MTGQFEPDGLDRPAFSLHALRRASDALLTAYGLTALASYATGIIIVCCRQYHCMPMAESLYAVIGGTGVI